MPYTPNTPQRREEFGSGTARFATEAKGPEGAASMMDKAKDVASTVTDKAQEMASSVAHRAEEMASTVTHRAEEAWDAGRHYFQEHDFSAMGDDLTNLIRRNPIPALFVGMGIGFLLARTFRS